MKRITVVMLLFALMFSGYAQKGKVTKALNLITVSKYREALEAVKEAETNEKSKGWYKTYYAKGRVMQAIGEQGDDALKAEVGDPLEQAYDNYIKALDAEEGDKAKKEVDLMLAALSNAFINQAVTAFNANDYDRAFSSFEYSVILGKMEIFGGVVDTTIIYNTALAAYNAKQYDKAIGYFREVAELDYEGSTPYVLMKNAHIAKGDSASALLVLQEGFEKYRDDETMVIELINYYLMTGGDSEAMKYLDLAIEKDSTNASYYHAQGILYDKAQDMEMAIKSYEKAIELRPEYFDSHYNLGALYFNKGVSLSNAAIDIIDNTEYMKAKEKIDEQFALSLPHLEAAHEVNAEDISTLETLKMLYYRLQDMDKHAEVEKKLEVLKGGQ